jgi:5-methyltetrahydropteroyltriglutamate--homocysteine methyltransferase
LTGIRDGLLVTTVVGSYPQPDWLIDRNRLSKRLPPRTRAGELWRVRAEDLEEAQDDATILAVRDMERAGIDVITDGETRRESYSNRFANALSGIDLDRPGTTLGRSGIPTAVPRIVAPIRRGGPVEVRDVEFLRSNTDRPIKITIPGPFTMTQQSEDDYYGDERALALDLAAAVNEEVRALHAAGADVVQLDEPYLEARPEQARAYGAEAVNRALESVAGTTALHVCFGYGHFIEDKPAAYSCLDVLDACEVDQLSIEAAQPGLDPSCLADIRDKVVVYGVVSSGDPGVETAENVADRIRAALPFVPPERLMPAPDCGMKYLPRAVAYSKLEALVAGTARVRGELEGRAHIVAAGEGLAHAQSN